MNTEWTTLLLQGFAGGITGYVTNNYALNMLFREYTPLKLGGVIKKTKNEFIAAISELVERDLLSPAHLKNEFLKEEALEEWNILFSSLWDEFFQAEFQQVPLEEIPGIQKSLPGWIDALVDAGLQPLQDGSCILPETKIETLLSRESFAFLLKRIVMQSSAEIQQGTMLDDFLRRLMNTLEGKSLSDFLNQTELAATCQKIDRLLQQGIKALKEDPGKITLAIGNLLDAEEIGDLLTKWETSWGSTSLSEILTEEQTGEISEQIHQTLDRLMQDESLSRLIKEISVLISQTDLLDQPLLDLFDDPTKQTVLALIHDTYADGFERLLHFLVERESELKDRVRRAAEKELSAQSGMLGGMIQGPLHSTIDQLDLKELVSGYRQQGEEALIRFLGAKTLRDLGVSPSEDQVKKIALTGLQYGKTHFDNAFERLLEKTPSQLIGSHWTDRFDEKRKALVADGIRNLILDWLSDQENHMEGISAPLMSFSQIQWSKENSERLLQAVKQMNFQPLQSTLIAQIDSLYEAIKSKPISSGWIQSALSRKDMQAGIKKQIHDMASEQLNAPIHDFLSRFNQTESRNAFGENLIDLIERHGEEFLDGQVAGLVKTNLQQRNEEEIVELAHDFIGRELQPITKFGFILGVIAGVLLALFPLPQTIMLGPIDLFPIGVFAIVGVLTNWIALQMIFRPYKEIRWLSKIPFFRHFAQGYLLKNQTVFAKNLAKFVDESLLNRNMIQQLFSDQKKSLKQRWLKWIPERLPGLSHFALKRKQKEMAKGISRQVQAAFRDHAESWGHSIAASLGAAALPSDDPRLMDWLGTRGNAMIRQGASKWMFENKEHPLGTWITAETLPAFLTPPLTCATWSISAQQLQTPAQTLAAKNLANQAMPKKEAAIENVLAGIPAAWIHRNRSQLVIRLRQTAETEIQKRESAIGDSVNQNIQNSLNFLQRGGFVLMGGPALIERILHRIITEELPDFLRQETETLANAFAPTLETLLTQKQADDWHLESKTNLAVQELLRQGLNHICEIGMLTADQFPANLSAGNEILNGIHMEANWIDPLIARELGGLAMPILENTTLQDAVSLMPVHSLTAIKDTIKDASDYPEIHHSGWRHIANTLTRNTVIGDWIPVSLLAERIECLLTTIGADSDYQVVLSGMAESALPALTTEVMSNTLLLDWLAENSFDPLYQSAHAQLPSLLSTLSFQDHIVNEVDALSPKGIHEIFLSFAGNYFFRLEVYGLFGAIFGLHPVLPGLALVSEGWNTFKRNQNKGESH